MLQDPAVFPEPTEFRPERYLNQDGTLRELERHEDPSIIGFGFGRRYVLEPTYKFQLRLQLSGPSHRICPGMFFAMNSIFIGIATMLYVFDISKARDENGNDILPDFRGFIRYVSVLQSCRPMLTHHVSHPVPFKCDIRPRSTEAASLVARAAAQE